MSNRRGHGQGRSGPPRAPQHSGQPGQQGGGGAQSAGHAQRESAIYGPNNGHDLPKSSFDVHAMENKLLPEVLADVNLSSLQVDDKIVTLPKRPAYVTLGKPLTVWANYMELEIRRKHLLHVYNINPREQDQLRGWKLRRVVQLLLQHTDFASEGCKVATDFQTSLVSTHKLSLRPEGYPVKFQEEKEDHSSANARTYVVHVAYNRPTMLSHLVDYLSSVESTMTAGEKDDAVKALNLIIWNYAKKALNLQTVRNKVFSFGNDVTWAPLRYGLHAVRGFFLSCRPATGRMLANINVANAVFYDAGPLKELMDKRWQLSTDLYRLESFLKRLKIDALHVRNENKKGDRIPRVRTIVGFARRTEASRRLKIPKFGAGPDLVQFFDEKENRWISIQDHFLSAYGLRVNPEYPVVRIQTPADKPNVYFPVEVCDVLPRQHTGRKLDPSETEVMRAFAVRLPAVNARWITGVGPTAVGFSRVENGELSLNPTMQALGVRVPNRELITTQARLLDCPKVMYGNQRMVTPKYSSWNIRGNNPNDTIKLASTPAGVRSWAYMIALVGHGRFNPTDQQKVDYFMTQYRTWLGRYGIQVGGAPSGHVARMPVLDDTQVQQHMRRAISPNNAEYLIIFIPGKAKNIRMYQAVKRVGDQVLGIHTMCIIHGKLSDRILADATYYTNLALKLNLKLGGRNHGLADRNVVGWLQTVPTMIMGIDVTHPSPGSRANAPSVGAVVANLDSDLGQWPAHVGVQEGKNEMVSFLRAATLSRLRLWRSAYQNRFRSKKPDDCYPLNIIVYRDGVSESQYDKVLNTEIKQIRDACREFYPPRLVAQSFPRITVVVIGKRHHTRFYPTQTKDADRTTNVPSGLVVDRGITEARQWDFFLVPHVALQGTVKPVHCFVLLDEVFGAYMADPAMRKWHQSAANMLTDFTHQLSYVFGRSTRAVSLCSPAYFADLACERARAWLARWFTDDASGEGVPQATDNDVQIHDSLRDTMFYM